MYVCLCNALTECQVRRAVQDGAGRPREVHGACGCQARCGGCARAILAAIRDAAASALAPGGQGAAVEPAPAAP